MDNLGIMISVFIAVLIGVILLGVVADDTNTLGRLNPVGNESVVSAANFTQVALDNDEVVPGSEVIVWANNTPVLASQYDIVYPTGLINFSTDGAAGMTTAFVSYQFFDENYVANQSARTIVNLVVLFMALGILGIALMWLGLFPDLKFKP